MTLGLLSSPVPAQTLGLEEDAKLTTSDGAAIDGFGHSVLVSFTADIGW